MRSRLWLVAALLAGSATPVLGAAAACAGTGDRAVLVVDTGDNAFSYCVSLPDDSISGLELIELANEQHGLQYRFGEGGQAVCMLANVGPEGDDCFGEYPDFWGFWRGDGSHGWTWSSVGAGSTLVKDGDVQGWSWGSGQDGSTHPKPPPTRSEDVCPPTAAPPAQDDGSKRKRQAGGSPPTGPGSSDVADQDGAASAPEQRKTSSGAEEPPQKSDVPKERLTPRTATASDRTPGAVTAMAEEDIDQGPPTTGLLALALVAALGAGGAAAMRRRKS